MSEVPEGVRGFPDRKGRDPFRLINKNKKQEVQMRIHGTKIMSSLSIFGFAAILLAGCTTANTKSGDVTVIKPAISSKQALKESANISGSARSWAATGSEGFYGMPGMTSGMGGVGGFGTRALLPRTFEATAAGKTEVEASKKACIDARKVAKSFHSGPNFLDITETEKKTNGWTATCDVHEFADDVVDSQNTPAKSPLLDVDFKVCRVGEKGTCKEINSGKFETFSGRPVPVGSTINTAYVSKVRATDSFGQLLSQKVVVPLIVTTGFEAVFTPILDRNGRIRVAFTLYDRNLKEMKTLRNGSQYPVVDQALSKSGTLDLSSGETKSVDLGKGFQMTVFSKVTSNPESGNS